MKLPSPVSPGQPLSAKAFNELLAYVRSLELRSGPGVIVQRSAAGTTVAAISAPAKGGGGPTVIVHPFQASDASASGVAKVRIRTGSVNDIVPTDVETDLTLTSAGTWRVYLDCTIDTAGVVTAATISTTSGSQPADTDTNAYITIAIATVTGSAGSYAVSGVSQLATHSLRFYACGRDMGSSSPGTYQFWGF